MWIIAWAASAGPGLGCIASRGQWRKYLIMNILSPAFLISRPVTLNTIPVGGVMRSPQYWYRSSVRLIFNTLSIEVLKANIHLILLMAFINHINQSCFNIHLMPIKIKACFDGAIFTHLIMSKPHLEIWLSHLMTSNIMRYLMTNTRSQMQPETLIKD